MYVYGEDTSVNPPVPGMRNGEVVSFRVNGVAATASPTLTWTNDRELHHVTLVASSPASCDPAGDGKVDMVDIMRVAARRGNTCS